MQPIHSNHRVVSRAQDDVPSYEDLKETLRQLGAAPYDLILPESHTLAVVLEPNERIAGLVYGRYKQGDQVGRGVLVATNLRVLLINKKPFFVKRDALSYSAISGVTYSGMHFGGTVTLYTRVGNISVRTFNRLCAFRFCQAIEANVFHPQNT